MNGVLASLAGAVVLLGGGAMPASAGNPPQVAPHLPLQVLADVPLGGHATRLDYASIDSARHLMFIAHLGDSEVIVFDTSARRVVTRIPAISRVHGVLAIPDLGRVYASATGTDEIVAIDENTLEIIARMPGGVYPDGLAYAPEAHKLYASDEHGGADTVIDVTTNARIATIHIGGTIGNTQYDPLSRHIFVNAQSAAELVEVDPARDVIVRRIPIPGAAGNHGLLLDLEHRAFVACEGNDRLIVLDLLTGKRLAWFPVAKDPDVLALDPSRHELYVAGESGVVSVFTLGIGSAITKLAEGLLAPSAHVVAVDPSTHEVYFPLQSLKGATALRITQPTP
jgi:DNA-binding beta-propeller fold protein YncE